MNSFLNSDPNVIQFLQFWINIWLGCRTHLYFMTDFSTLWRRISAFLRPTFVGANRTGRHARWIAWKIYSRYRRWGLLTFARQGGSGFTNHNILSGIWTNCGSNIEIYKEFRPSDRQTSSDKTLCLGNSFIGIHNHHSCVSNKNIQLLRLLTRRFGNHIQQNNFLRNVIRLEFFVNVKQKCLNVHKHLLYN